MPPAKKRRSPLDRFTDASPTAISAGFSAAMSLGPQPRPFGSGSGSGGNNSIQFGSSPTAASTSSGLGGGGEGLTGSSHQEGASWLQSLRHASGITGGGDDASEDENSDTEVPSTAAAGPSSKSKSTNKKSTKRRKTTTTEDDASTIKNTGGGGGGTTSDVAVDEEEAARNRKAQNRIAQREFRQRKQQYIRALEARVELLSSDHDTQVDRLRHALRGLLAENNTLRSMLGSLARFIGEAMLGGPLQQTGISREELLEMINGRSEKTMTDAWQNWPGAKECEALRQIRVEANIPPEGLPDMRNSPGPSSSTMARANSAKKARKGKNSTNDNDNPDANAAAATADGQGSSTVPTAAECVSGMTGGMAISDSPVSYSQAPRSNIPPTSNSSNNNNTANTNLNMNPNLNSSVNMSGINPMMQASFPQVQQQQQQMTQPYLMAPSPFSFGAPTPNSGQDNAVLAGLFGADGFYQGLTPSMFAQPQPQAQNHNDGIGSYWPPAVNPTQQQPQQQQPFNPGNFDNAGAMKESTDSLIGNNGSVSQLGNAVSASTPQNQQTTSGMNTDTPASTTSSAATPRSAFQNGAMQFFSYLRSVEKNDDVHRLQSIAQRLNQARAAQGQATTSLLDEEWHHGDFHQDNPPRQVDVSPLTPIEPLTEEEAHRMTETSIQLAYHMSNYRRNASYRLPSLLRPTDLQLTRPHDPIVDTIVLAGLRDAVILNHETLNVDEMMFHLFNAVVLGTGDIYLTNTWMLNQRFILEYPQLATQDVIEATNRWRKLKGLQPITDVQQILPSSSHDANNKKTAKDNSTAATPATKPKGKRGRPRKQPLPQADSASSETANANANHKTVAVAHNSTT
ncbi:unnamed protein product [Sympodiomycopsis kandeliae]